MSRRTPPRSLRSWVITASPLLLLVATGCVERYFRVETSPPGADVYLNGEYMGRSPVEQSFTHYGTYRVDAHLRPTDDFEDYLGFVEVPRPWYQIPVIDFFAELVDPRTHVDRHVHVVDLQPLPALVPTMADTADESFRELLDRAQAVREAAR